MNAKPMQRPRSPCVIVAEIAGRMCPEINVGPLWDMPEPSIRDAALVSLALELAVAVQDLPEASPFEIEMRTLWGRMNARERAQFIKHIEAQPGGDA